jgi:hypothetical protein
MKNYIMNFDNIEDVWISKEAERPYIHHVFFFYIDDKEKEREFIFTINMN